MSRTFQLRLVRERNPILIVADTDQDAMAQMREISKISKKPVLSFMEVFERPSRFNQQFARIFQ
jgi:hypothetical protein